MPVRLPESGLPLTPPAETTPEETGGHTRVGVAAVIVAVVLWSTGNLIVRGAPMAGVQIAFWRVAAGAALYWIVLRLTGRKLTWKQFKTSWPAGAAIGLELAFFFVAIKSTTVANATVLGTFQPIIVIAFGIRRFGERITGWLVVMAMVAIGGVSLVVFGSSTLPVWSPRGDLLAIVAMLLFSAYFILAKSARSTVPAFEFQTALWIASTVALLPVAVFDAGGLVFPTSEQWPWLAMLLAIPATGHLLINWAHTRVALSVASLLTLGTPVLSAAGAALFFDEAVGPLQAAGIAIVVGALSVVISRNTPRRAAPAKQN